MTDPAPPSHALKALEDLLLSMFSASEMRRLLRYLPNGGRLVAELPDRGVSPKELAGSAVKVLVRNSETDSVFDAMRAERPRRTDEVDRVQAYFAGTAVPPATLRPAVQKTTNGLSMDERRGLLRQLGRLKPVDFDELIYVLGVDHTVVEQRAEHRRRTLQLLRHIEEKHRVPELQAALRDLP